MSQDSRIVKAVQDALRLGNLKVELSAVHGGDIHHSVVARFQPPSQSARTVFVKHNDVRHRAVLESEFTSLSLLVNTHQLVYPKPIAVSSDAESCYLLMAYHPLSNLTAASSPEDMARRLGELLARQHRITDHQFGWPEDNFIGLTPQTNLASTDWVAFYAEQRLGAQLALAKKRGLPEQLLSRMVELITRLDDFFLGYQPQPSLLHGDLWSGNFAIDTALQQPMLFDPAPYFGDREADIAMTELFGGFPERFYQSYQQQYPLHADYEKRKPLYNLYHALNHFNLFGAAYAGMIGAHLDALLSVDRP